LATVVRTRLTLFFDGPLASATPAGRHWGRPARARHNQPCGGSGGGNGRWGGCSCGRVHHASVHAGAAMHNEQRSGRQTRRVYNKQRSGRQKQEERTAFASRLSIIQLTPPRNPAWLQDPEVSELVNKCMYSPLIFAPFSHGLHHGWYDGRRRQPVQHEGRHGWGCRRGVWRRCWHAQHRRC